MIYIFDLDYTLLDAKRFKEDLSSVFGMSVEEFGKSYFENFKSKGINYNLNSHLAILEKDGFIANKEQTEGVKERFNEFMKNIDEYLFPGAEEIIKSLKERGDELVLATFGDIEWQKLKVNSLKLKKYFDRVIYEDKSKKENKELKSLRNRGEKIIIVNDNARELNELKDVFGSHCETKLIHERYSGNAKYEGKIYNDLSDAFKEMEQNEISGELRGVK